MKVEVELPPGVYPTDAEVQELLQKFQEIKATTFKQRLHSMLLCHIKAAEYDEGKATIATDAALMAFRHLIESTEVGNVLTPECLRKALLERLK